MPPQMWEKGAEGVKGRPDFGVSVTFPGPEPIPAALHPLLDGSCCAVTPEHITQGPSSVHRPLNPALAAAASSLHAGFALAESSASFQELFFSFLWLH